jgi:hypothetical protein
MAQPLEKALNRAGELIVAQMRATLKKNKSNATGTLSESISYTVKDTENGLKLLIGMEQYGEAVDGGRSRSRSGGPKQSWRQRIIQWMRAKNITPRGGVSLETAAFLITRKINERGYKPKPFIDVSIDKVLKEVYTDIEDDMVVIIEEALKAK